MMGGDRDKRTKWWSLVCFWGFVLLVWLFVGFLCVLFLVLFLLTPEGLATSLGLAPLVVMR